MVWLAATYTVSAVVAVVRWAVRLLHQQPVSNRRIPVTPLLVALR
jgi:hypothetical protein